MAFDLYCAGAHVAIEPYEDYLLVKAAASSQRYPQLTAIWDQYYSSPVIQPNVANGILHELLNLYTDNPEDAVLSRMLLKILPFLSLAYRSGQPIRCVGD